MINIGIIIFVLSAIVTFIVTRFNSKRRQKLEKVFNEKMSIYATNIQDDNIDEEDLDIKSKNIEKKAHNYAKEHPDIVADLIKIWMKN